jgi:peptidoglycan/xylan/chitin deacetylase (PgdA/CDA1 family)
VIPEAIERRARWVLDTLGARGVAFGEDVPYRPESWEQVDRGERPTGDEVAEAFFHLARVEERGGPRDEHGRFRAGWSCLDPLDPPVERLRRSLEVDPPRWGGAGFAVALTHDVDTPWRWTRSGLRGGASRLKGHVLAGHAGPALREARGLAAAPWHRVRGTDPNWRFEQLLAEEAARGGSSTFFVLAGHGDPHDGGRPDVYERLRPRLVETILEHGGEVGLHGTYLSAEDPSRLRRERDTLAEVMAVYTGITPELGQRYHYLRVDPHRNLRPLAELGLIYDSTLAFPDAVGFRVGIAHPFRPWDLERDEPLDLVEVPLAAMEVTLAEERYLGLSAREAWSHFERLLDWASEYGGGFSVLWHPDRFDPATSAGWDRLYYRLLDEIRARGGVCTTAGALADEARSWLDGG